MEYANQVLASDAVLKRIEKKCQQKCHDPNDSDACFVYVLDKLKENNFERLRRYQGTGSMDGFLNVAVNRLIVDFKISKYGKSRIPKMVRDLGELAEAVYRFVCWQKYSFREAYFLVRERRLFQGTEEEFEERIRPVRLAPCRQYPTMAALPDGTDDHQGPELQGPEEDNPLAALIDRLDTETGILAARAIREFVDQLPEEEQMMFRLRFGEGFSVSKVARVHGQNRKVISRRLDGLRTRILEKLLALGLR